ncbi:hypothetical protein HO133_002356 [Letharia lupina]|uniref:Uncharacterized protein n=1 Tax=Letharia lupina TaxID=560253 RepID=A0A8H6CDN8_9LECA|nr:uncharacterized protein HO133_002356 [Letharia lupina]KAF6221500.1 hypothetical protein HO133_002356 [Letharia lupina]
MIGHPSTNPASTAEAHPQTSPDAHLPSTHAHSQPLSSHPKNPPTPSPARKLLPTPPLPRKCPPPTARPPPQCLGSTSDPTLLKPDLPPYFSTHRAHTRPQRRNSPSIPPPRIPGAAPRGSKRNTTTSRPQLLRKTLPLTRSPRVPSELNDETTTRPAKRRSGPVVLDSESHTIKPEHSGPPHSSTAAFGSSTRLPPSALPVTFLTLTNPGISDLDRDRIDPARALDPPPPPVPDRTVAVRRLDRIISGNAGSAAGDDGAEGGDAAVWGGAGGEGWVGWCC